MKIREICGDYALDIERGGDKVFTIYFNSHRNAETVKRCIEVDRSVPNVATAVDFVEVIRCKDCKYCLHSYCLNSGIRHFVNENDYCSFAERKDEE